MRRITGGQKLLFFGDDGKTSAQTNCCSNKANRYILLTRATSSHWNWHTSSAPWLPPPPPPPQRLSLLPPSSFVGCRQRRINGAFYSMHSTYLSICLQICAFLHQRMGRKVCTSMPGPRSTRSRGEGNIVGLASSIFDKSTVTIEGNYRRIYEVSLTLISLEFSPTVNQRCCSNTHASRSPFTFSVRGKTRFATPMTQFYCTQNHRWKCSARTSSAFWKKRKNSEQV